MQIHTEGLVIRESSVGESDRLVTLLTREEGVVRAFARKAKTLRSRQASSTQLLCYSRLTLYKGRDKYMINDAHPIEVFFDLRGDLERLSLAQYFCELAGFFAPEAAPAGDFLRLILNALHFLTRRTRPLPLLKAVVEMRLLALAGYMPNLVCCRECACYEADRMLFFPWRGELCCASCWENRRGEGLQPGEPVCPLGKGTLTGLRHTVYADLDKLFAFRLPEAGLRELEQVSEQYLLHTAGRGFQTLEFYRQMELAGMRGVPAERENEGYHGETENVSRKVLESPGTGQDPGASGGENRLP